MVGQLLISWVISELNAAFCALVVYGGLVDQSSPGLVHQFLPLRVPSAQWLRQVAPVHASPWRGFVIWLGVVLICIRRCSKLQPLILRHRAFPQVMGVSEVTC